jgi:hypothetical protein
VSAGLGRDIVGFGVVWFAWRCPGWEVDCGLLMLGLGACCGR